jgi:hypothetical protein
LKASNQRFTLKEKSNHSHVLRFFTNFYGETQKSVFLDNKTKTENFQALQAFLGTKTKQKGTNEVTTEVATSKTKKHKQN